MNYAAIFANIDILNIPSIAGKLVGSIWLLCLGCTVPVFVMACMYEHTKFLKNDDKDRPDFYGTAWRMIIFLLSFIAYGLVMKIAYIFDYVSMTLLSWSDWSAFVKILAQKATASNSINLFNFHFSTLLMYGTLFLAAISEILFMGLRFILLYVAYCVGPILLLLGIYRPLRESVNGWLTFFFQVSFWPITMKLAQSAVLAFQFKSFIEGGNPFVTTMVSILMIAMYFIGVPTMTAMFLSQKNMGAMADGIASSTKSLAASGVGAASGAVTGFIGGAMAEAGMKGVEGAGEAATQAASSAQPTISSGDTSGNSVNDDKSISDSGSSSQPPAAPQPPAGD